jgi:SAM-dependent methyltransferase
VNLSRARVLRALARALHGTDDPARVLVVGAGRQRDDVAAALGGRRHALVCVDVNPAADVDVVCDAHDLPFFEGSFDAVVITAVLEHVVDPARVVAELRRVLEPGGLVYAETPFLQRVHEGAYDFTRFSLSGHRLLFRDFDELEAGLTAGPATALAWSLESLLLTVFGRGLVSRGVARLGCFWIKYLDHLLAGRPGALDAASCTYFFGRAAAGRAVAEIVDGYRS